MLHERLPLYNPYLQEIVDFHQDTDSTIKLIEGGLATGTTTALVMEWMMVAAAHPTARCIWMTDKDTFRNTTANTMTERLPDSDFTGDFDHFPHPAGADLHIVGYEHRFPRPDYLFLELGHTAKDFNQWDVLDVGARSQVAIESKYGEVPELVREQMSCYTLPSPIVWHRGFYQVNAQEKLNPNLPGDYYSDLLAVTGPEQLDGQWGKKFFDIRGR